MRVHCSTIKRRIRVRIAVCRIERKKCILGKVRVRSEVTCGRVIRQKLLNLKLEVWCKMQTINIQNYFLKSQVVQCFFNISNLSSFLFVKLTIFLKRILQLQFV